MKIIETPDRTYIECDSVEEIFRLSKTTESKSTDLEIKNNYLFISSKFCHEYNSIKYFFKKSIFDDDIFYSVKKYSTLNGHRNISIVVEFFEKNNLDYLIPSDVLNQKTS